MTMTDLPTKEIQNRIFEALDYLIAIKTITGIRDFCEKHGFNQTKLYKQRSDYFEGETLQYKTIEFKLVYVLAKEYNISLDWVVLGKGEMKLNDF